MYDGCATGWMGSAPPHQTLMKWVGEWDNRGLVDGGEVVGITHVDVDGEGGNASYGTCGLRLACIHL